MNPSLKIYPMAKIVGEKKNFSSGEFSQIDDFCFINIGNRLHLGKFVHLSSFVSIIGGGECEICDFAGLSAGCRLITGTDDFSGGYLTNPTVPEEFKNIRQGSIKIGRHSLLGSNVVVMPDVSIGDGATVGAGSIVTKNLEDWTIYAGFSPRKIGERNREEVLSKENKLLKKLKK